MNKPVFVMTEDDFLFQKIYLILLGENMRAFRGRAHESPDSIALIDIDTVQDMPRGAIRMSRHSDCELSLPFREEELLCAVLEDSEASAPLTLGNRCVYLHQREIKLTEVEYSLLAMLYSRGGFVSREELLRSVWGEGADGSVLNVYVHYLREKLEFLGEKIIISSRGQGYKIDEKFLPGGGVRC